MNKLSKKTEYALMALNLFQGRAMHLNMQMRSPHFQGLPALILSAKEVAEKIHAPFDVVARVLQVLSSRGILKAEYGVLGGYALYKNLDDVTLHDLIETLESSSDLTKCVGSESDCEHSKNCTIISPIHKLNDKVQNFYKSIKVSEVLNV